MQARIDQLLELLDLEPLDTHLFRGVSPAGERNRVFGGQVLGQALVAAGRTVDERLLHSMHAYFLRPGDPKRPILYEVERSRDGGSFTSRRVVAIQQGKPIFNLSASFQRAEPGLDHQAQMVETAPPELFVTEEEQLALLYQQDPQNYRHPDYFQWPIEFRHVDHSNSRRHEAHPPQHRVWMRAVAPLPDALILHQCILAYASDRGLLGTALLPHAISIDNPRLQAASLNHAMWFHRPFRADEWLLYVQESPSASNGRGFCLGHIYRSDGVLVASTAQEGLIRHHPDPDQPRRSP